MKSLDFWIGFVDGCVAGLSESHVEISDDISWTYSVKIHKKGWLLNFRWIYEHGEEINVGNDYPSDFTDDKEHEVEFYFLFNEKSQKVKNEILNSLEDIKDSRYEK